MLHIIIKTLELMSQRYPNIYIHETFYECFMKTYKCFSNDIIHTGIYNLSNDIYKQDTLLCEQISELQKKLLLEQSQEPCLYINGINKNKFMYKKAIVELALSHNMDSFHWKLMKLNVAIEKMFYPNAYLIVSNQDFKIVKEWVDKYNKKHLYMAKENGNIYIIDHTSNRILDH